ncbi:hypothetical protein TrST_g13413 [Triparma strigata]|uniref:Uncharacterized protein n=1 Tax=Triparma strigata TaxID=1606541 RepID=A0A9W7EY81_9STRA|nr:hypothetical protein TrST_g13413 [Triparma strigata]
MFAVLPSLALLTDEQVLKFDTQAFPLNEMTAKQLDVGVSTISTGKLHECALHLGIVPPGAAASKGPWRHLVQDRWKHNPHRSEINSCYLRWLKEVIGPLMLAKGETEMWYSTELLIRFHTPCPLSLQSPPPPPRLQDPSKNGSTRPYGKRKGVNRRGISTKRHSDRDYGHPSGELNVWLPLNDHAYGTNSLFRDRKPWAGEGSSRPFDLRYGEYVLWYGNGCPHETRMNVTDVTRVSFDFRVIPGTLFEERGACRTFDCRGTYFSKMLL